MNFGDVAAYVIVVALSQVKSAVYVAPTFLCGQSRQVTGWIYNCQGDWNTTRVGPTCILHGRK
jgi:hypothetical protein